MRITISEMAAVFAEWQRQWQEDPEAFYSADEAFGQAPNEYGPRATRTFRRIRRELTEGAAR
jgi:hypothetical protein